MQGIVGSVYLSDLEVPLKKLAMERQKKHNSEDSAVDVTNSLYREILFLACKAIGRANVDLNAFDRIYSTAYHRVLERNNKLYGPQDKPLSISALYCRQYFRPLSLP